MKAEESGNLGKRKWKSRFFMKLTLYSFLLQAGHYSYLKYLPAEYVLLFNSTINQVSLSICGLNQNNNNKPLH